MALLGAAALLVYARPAAAQTFGTCDKQDGVAVSDQYCEKPLPNPGGPQAPPTPPLKMSLPTDVVRELKRAGAVGELLLDLGRVAPPSVIQAQAGGRARKVVDADRLLAMGALGTPITPEGAGKMLAKTAAIGAGFAKTFRWGLLVTTFLLLGASWQRYRARSSST